MTPKAAEAQILCPDIVVLLAYSKSHRRTHKCVFINFFPTEQISIPEINNSFKYFLFKSNFNYQVNKNFQVEKKISRYLLSFAVL